MWIWVRNCTSGSPTIPPRSLLVLLLRIYLRQKEAVDGPLTKGYDFSPVKVKTKLILLTTKESNNETKEILMLQHNDG